MKENTQVLEITKLMYIHLKKKKELARSIFISQLLFPIALIFINLLSCYGKQKIIPLWVCMYRKSFLRTLLNITLHPKVAKMQKKEHEQKRNKTFPKTMKEIKENTELKKRGIERDGDAWTTNGL